MSETILGIALDSEFSFFDGLHDSGPTNQITGLIVAYAYS